MFGGKKITASCNNKIIQTKPNKQITTKITQQIIGKSRQSIKNINSYLQQQSIQKGEKTDRLEKMNKNTKIDSLNRQKQILKGNKKQMIPTNQKNMNKNNKQINKKQQTDPNKMYSHLGKEKKNNDYKDKNISKYINELSNKQKQKPQLYIQNTQIQQYQDEDQKQMSGEHDFVKYSDNQQGQQEQQQLRAIPQPYEEIKIPEHPIQTYYNNIGYNKQQIKQFGQFNMDVFSLQAEQIMAKQYFIV